ncbi:MAG: T9SS type A sorting domain-containing protein, partial [Bacteroidia bacterium]|nr:T9SS type A sorting domain-containing protein [Bacteroidia bacterium]
FLLTCLIQLSVHSLNAQNYMISFAGSGATTSVGSIKVENLTKKTTVTLGGGDILNLIHSTGIDQSEYGTCALKVYPNPMTDCTTLTFFVRESGNTVIRIHDITGRTVKQISKSLMQGTSSFRISGISKGNYIVKVQGKGFSYSTQLVSLYNTKSQPIIESLTSEYSTAISTFAHPLKSTKSVVKMQYSQGDHLLYRGISNPYTTIITDAPRQDTTITFQFVGCTDYNGNNYATVQIGRQIWMAENLKSTHYSDGTPIEFLNYNNDASNVSVYGRIYTPAAARRSAASSITNPSNVKGAAPNGWHIPSKAEWMELVTYLGGLNIAGGKMKETGTSHWKAPNIGATNEYGFTALPGGVRDFAMGFLGKGEWLFFLTATAPTSRDATGINIAYDNTLVFFGDAHPDDAGSVRCVKDF